MHLISVWCGRSVFLVSAVLVPVGFVQAQTTASPIPMFDQPGTGSCNAANASDCVNSIITQVTNPDIGIAVGIGWTPDPHTKLVVAQGVPFSPAGLFQNIGRGLDAASTTGFGIEGDSFISAGVLGDTDNPYAPGVLARSADFSTENLGLRVFGYSELHGVVTLAYADLGGQVDICRNVESAIAFCSSSLRYKTAVRPFSRGLDIVRRLRPIAFTWKQSGTRDLGLAAEDVEQVEPLLTFANDQGEVEGVKYDQLSAVFVNAFAEQQAQIQRGDEQMTRQQHDLAALKVLTCASHPDTDICR